MYLGKCFHVYLVKYFLVYLGKYLSDLYLGSSNTDPRIKAPDLDFDICNQTAGILFPTFTSATDRQEKQYLCDTKGRYVILQIDGGFHILTLKDIKVYAGRFFVCLFFALYSGKQMCRDINSCTCVCMFYLSLLSCCVITNKLKF